MLNSFKVISPAGGIAFFIWDSFNYSLAKLVIFGIG